MKESDLTGWLGDEGKLEALFLGEIAESATPTIVHSPVTAQLFEERYGVIPCYLPFSIYRPWTADELTPACRSAARARLGLEAGEVAIATFGFVHSSKAPEECIWALEVLRGWGIPASLHFVGGIDTVAARTALRVLVDDLGLTKRVHFAQGYVSEQDYRDYLVGADLGVQLRTYSLGALSGGLLDCAAAGLPTVTNELLGAAVGVPRYIHCIPDALSPLLLAEALATLLDSGLAANRPEAARRAYSEQRSFTAYSRGCVARWSLTFGRARSRTKTGPLTNADACSPRLVRAGRESRSQRYPAHRARGNPALARPRTAGALLHRRPGATPATAESRAGRAV